MDSCQAGLGGAEKLGTNDVVVSSVFIRDGGPHVVLADSKDRQLSLEDSAFGCDQLTLAIANVPTQSQAQYDTNHCELIDLSELYRGVKQPVTRKSHNEQKPWLARNGLVDDLSLL